LAMMHDIDLFNRYKRRHFYDRLLSFTSSTLRRFISLSYNS